VTCQDGSISFAEVSSRRAPRQTKMIY